MVAPLSRLRGLIVWQLGRLVRKIRGRFFVAEGRMKGRGRGSCQHAVSIAVIAALAAAALAGAAAQASAAPAHASAAHGKAISYTCLGCHGIDDYKNAYPMYSVPKLEGQNPEYLAAALHGYRDGDRSHLTMHSQASTLSDKDMEDIAAYFAGDRKSTRLNSSHPSISYAVFCLKKKTSPRPAVHSSS